MRRRLQITVFRSLRQSFHRKVRPTPPRPVGAALTTGTCSAFQARGTARHGAGGGGRPRPRQVCAAASGQSRRGALARRGDDGTHDTQARETRGWDGGPGGLPLTRLCFQKFSRGRGSRSRVENEAIRFCEFSVTQSPERNLRKRGMVEGFPRRTLCGLCPRGAHAGSGRAAPVWPQGNGQARAPGPAPRSARMNRGPSPPPVGHARLTVPSGT